jgi:uncharacterized protein
MNNPKVEIKMSKFGKGLFAADDIKKDEFIADFNGQIYEAEKVSDLPKNIADYAIQFEKHKWRDSDFAWHINHSCNPNCGIRGLFQIVAMRDIQKGEELFYDYEMTEDSDWKMECKCGEPNCRKIIGAYSNMPQEVREKYKGYISEWLTK